MPVGINGIGGTLPIPSVPQARPVQETSPESFQNLLGDAIGSLEKLQSEADVSAARFVAGEPVELHEVLLATERVSIAFQLVVQARNKVVEAYQDVMRMQV